MLIKQNLSTAHQILHDFIKDIPNKISGVYRMLDASQKILYVGKAKNLKVRLRSYTRLDLPSRTLRMVSQITNIEIIKTATEAEALLLEASLIKKLKPKYNILLRDDKTYPYIKIQKNHDFPQVTKYRGSKLENGTYFGPFASAMDVDRTIHQILKIFKLRSCTDNYFAARARPCLQYQIKRCTAPCVGKISKEDYNKLIDEVNLFLCGKSQKLQQQLAEQMNYFSEKMQYEDAAAIRDKIKSLSAIQSSSSDLVESGISDADILAIYSEKNIYCVQVFIIRGGNNYGNKAYFPINTDGYDDKEVLTSFVGQFYQTHQVPKEILVSHELTNQQEISDALAAVSKVKLTIKKPTRGNKRKIIDFAIDNAKNALKIHSARLTTNLDVLKEVQELFELTELPNRIEVYDNSHIFGKFPIGAMVVASPHGFEKNEYRVYNIKQQMPVSGGDDYLMLREVLTRRLKRIQNNSSPKPDLMIIDGGKGHLSVVNDVFKNFESLKIKYVCMSKGVDRHAGNEIFHLPEREAFTLDKNTKLMRYLQILRDEAHNFAINSHRKKRQNKINYSKLDEISGIGPIRKKILLAHFGSFEAVRNATIKDLTKVKGINKKYAEYLYNILHEVVI